MPDLIPEGARAAIPADIILPNGAGGSQPAASATTHYPGIWVLYTSGFPLDEIHHKRRELNEFDPLSKSCSGKNFATNVDQLLDGMR